jgi:hypothetical protein
LSDDETESIGADRKRFTATSPSPHQSEDAGKSKTQSGLSEQIFQGHRDLNSGGCG